MPRPSRFAPVPIVQEAGRAPVLVWKGAESLVPTGILSPDRAARLNTCTGITTTLSTDNNRPPLNTCTGLTTTLSTDNNRPPLNLLPHQLTFCFIFINLQTDKYSERYILSAKTKHFMDPV